MNKRVIVIIAIIGVVITLSVFKLVSNKNQIQKKLYIHDLDALVLVEVKSPSLHTFEHDFTYLGVFEAAKQNMVGAEAGGKVIALDAEEGSFVTKGSVIAKLDKELMQLQLEAAELNLASLKNDQKRNHNLEKENAIAAVQVEKTNIGVESASIAVKQLKRQLKNTAIIAPFSGVITKKLIDVGSVIGAGTPVVELTDIQQLKLTISVPEQDVMKFKLGQKVSVLVDVFADRVFEGTIHLINVQADRSHNFKVQVLIKNDGQQKIMAGMYGSVKLQNTQSKSALAIPRIAVIGSTKKPQVFVVRNGKAKLIQVEAGITDGDYIEVLGGLKDSDQIVTKGQINLEDGSNVKIK